MDCAAAAVPFDCGRRDHEADRAALQPTLAAAFGSPWPTQWRPQSRFAPHLDGPVAEVSTIVFAPTSTSIQVWAPAQAAARPAARAS
jgi:hypothetical protein